MRRLDAAALALLALAAAAVLAGLERFPALTADEAWIGLFAGRLGERGLYTPHEMNTYTGPLYGLGLAEVFRRLGTDLATLRLPGALLNAAALLLTWLFLRRRHGAETALWWAALAAGSSFFLMKARVAWEVYALQPFLLSLTFWALERPLLLLLVTLIGVQNHFIYISVPLSLCLLSPAAFPALTASAAVFLVKPRLSEAAWLSQRAWALPLLAALPALAWMPRWTVRVPKVLLALGIIGAALWHGPAYWQVLAGPVVWKRVLSWDAPWWLDAPLLLWSAALLLLVLRNARDDERILARWPLAYAAVFLLFRHTSSLRYYSLLHWLVLPAAALALSRLPSRPKRWAAGIAAAALLLNQGVFWREWSSPRDRRPLEFRAGWRRESSWDFARKEALFAAHDASRACRVAHMERSFTSLPVFWRAETLRPRDCDPRLSFDAEQCRDCAAPPYFRWKTVSP